MSVKTLFGFFFACALIFTVSCDKDSGLYARIHLDNDMFKGKVSGAFSGNGGNENRLIYWENESTTANYDISLNSGTTGEAFVRIKDADGIIVWDGAAGSELRVDLISGTTEPGTPGRWVIYIGLNTFEGEGTYTVATGD